MEDLLFGMNGKRKYLTAQEQAQTLVVAETMAPHIGTLCGVIAITGLRISEALSLTPSNIDFVNGVIVTRCLKKRRKHIFRSIPVPRALLDGLVAVHDLKIETAFRDERRLWPVSRMTAYRWICSAMKMAGVSGPQASPKGLRHGFGVSAIQSGVPLNMVQRWLGHADIRTTAIYTHAIGPEERAIASKMWGATPGTDAAPPPTQISACTIQEGVVETRHSSPPRRVSPRLASALARQTRPRASCA